MIAYKHLPSGEIAMNQWFYSEHDMPPDWVAGTGWFKHMRPGDWAVMDKFGLVEVISAEEFETKFRLVEVEDAPRALGESLALETI